MHILIPAGGRGVRLRPLTDHSPKPLLPLGDRPILTRIIDGLPTEAAVTVLVSPALESQFRRWKDTQCSHRNAALYVEGSREAGPAGPVVAVADCIRDLGISDDLVILMGDSLLPFSLPQFLAGTDGRTLRLAAYELPDVRDAARFGVIEWGKDGAIRSFEEKPACPRSPWIFMGCLFMPARLLSALHDIAAGCPTQMGDLVANYLQRGEQVTGYPVHGNWHDIGTFTSYLEAHRAFLSPAQRQSLMARGNDLEGVVYVDPSARVSHSRLRNCIVQAGAKVDDAMLTDCVVHPSVSVVGRNIYGKLLSPHSEVAFKYGVPQS